MKEYSIGVDIGGTNIKAGVVNEKAELVSSVSVKTKSGEGYESVLSAVFEAIDGAVAESKLSANEIGDIGVGCPGTMDNAAGVVVYSNNLHWDNVPLAKDIEKKYGRKVYLENDANVAAYGEFIAGAAKNTDTAVILTLGTGVGAGIIINGEIYSGSNGAGGEIGHMVIETDGVQCTCGRKGCFEVYASATGLKRMTAEMIEKYPDGMMKKLSEQDGKISARTAFNAAKLGGDDGRMLVEKYIKYLSCGIANVINIFQPDILCIGGGVCNEGDNLLIPLKEAVAGQIYTKSSKKNTEIAICSLGNTAGTIGAAMLALK